MPSILGGPKSIDRPAREPRPPTFFETISGVVKRKKFKEKQDEYLRKKAASDAILAIKQAQDTRVSEVRAQFAAEDALRTEKRLLRQRIGR